MSVVAGVMRGPGVGPAQLLPPKLLLHPQHQRLVLLRGSGSDTVAIVFWFPRWWGYKHSGGCASLKNGSAAGLEPILMQRNIIPWMKTRKTTQHLKYPHYIIFFCAGGGVGNEELFQLWNDTLIWSLRGGTPVKAVVMYSGPQSSAYSLCPCLL